MSIWEVVGGIVGGLGQTAINYRADKKNRQAQYDFAQQGTKWRLDQMFEVARREKIHPLAMLGNSGGSLSFSPQGPVASGLGRMGQNVGRAMDERKYRQAQVENIKAHTKSLQLDNTRRQNEINGTFNQPSDQTAHPIGNAPTGQASARVQPARS